MHELALMGDILQLVFEDAELNEIKKIDKVELIVGELSSAMPDALRMAFSIITEQNPALFSNQARLIIHLEEAVAGCIFCGIEYRPEHKISFCPTCQVPSGKVIKGETFQILSYEGEV